MTLSTHSPPYGQLPVRPAEQPLDPQTRTCYNQGDEWVAMGPRLPGTIHRQLEVAGMRISYTPDQEELRRELRSYFTELITPDRREALNSTSGEYGTGNVYRETVAQMGRDGWLALGWPTEYGGQARSAMDQLIFTDEAAIAGAPVPFLTINSVAPTIMTFGSEEQKAFFLPKIASGDLHFAIGYSEPGAGTDLANLRTTAVRDGDDYLVNGQKMWTSLIQYADYVWLAARTNAEAKKHHGISVLIVPTTSDGFSWTPVHTMAGVDTSATYYQDVRVPVANRVGDENGGWKLVTNQLNHERVALVSPMPIIMCLNQVREWAQNTKDAGGARLIDSEWVQLNLARVHAKVEVLKLINWELASGQGKSDSASPSPADASAAKVFGTELATEAYRMLMEVLGTAATLRPDSPGALLRGRVERMHRSCLILTFGGGTNEVQRDIIGMVALGLPRANR
jgi:3-oxocholest-4-en-26-oyl-CoA dehydrogenase alpha subunit